MSLARPRRPFDPRSPSRFTLPRAPTVTIVRVALLATLAAIGATWALVYHYGFHPAPMLVPATPAPSATYDADAGEIPVPELEPTP